ncbi:MAG: DUF3224 domain-containing protein [Paracoccaceae bacterium]
MQTGKFSITKWDEQSLADLPAPQKFNRGQVERTHTGILTGTEIMQYTLLYTSDQRSEFTGIGLFNGTFNGHEGNFALIERGHYKDGTAHTRFVLLKLTKTTGFSDILGTGSYTTSAHSEVTYSFKPA